MDIDSANENPNELFASSIDPSRINDRFNQQVMQVANRMYGQRSDTMSLEEGKEEFKNPSSARLHTGGNGGHITT